MFSQLKTDFAGTSAAAKSDAMIASPRRGAAANKIQNAVAMGTKFPAFAEKNLSGNPLALADYKGKNLCGAAVEKEVTRLLGKP